MVLSIAAAAGGQLRLGGFTRKTCSQSLCETRSKCACGKRGEGWSQAENYRQQNGEKTPHPLYPITAEGDSLAGSGIIGEIENHLSAIRKRFVCWVRKALAAGKSVVTANKKLIAYQGVELEKLAVARGGHLKYGAAVAGGIPVIPGLEQGLSGDRIERIEGILNGTCNFILSKMEAGAEYTTVLAEAQAKGYAEADPTEDVGGFDARAKLSILMRLALRVEVNPDEIVPRPITTITAVDFSYARDLGCTIRQVARADRAGGQVAATVGPMLVDLHSPLAWSRGTENMVIATGHYGGDVVFSGHGAGGQPTAVAVVSDLALGPRMKAMCRWPSS
jgi:homoserine dehydrogenase